MKRILSEKNIVVILFVITLVFFVFAQQETAPVEKMYFKPRSSVSSAIPFTNQASNNIISADNVAGSDPASSQ